jgi:phosphoribosylformylglycinamidine synthase
MSDACRVLDFPVVSGNVSLYNETEGRAILPTPAIGGLGVLDDAARSIGIGLRPGLGLVLVGTLRGHLGQSLWLREIAGLEDGPPPPVDLQAERKLGDFIRAQIGAGAITACHDVSDGGLLVAITEMALAGDCGARLDHAPGGIAPHAFWFGEDQGCYVVAVLEPDAFFVEALVMDLPAVRLGWTGGEGLKLDGVGTISLETLRAEHERFFPAWMETR